MKKLIFALTCLFIAIPCQARIITVDDDGSSDFNTIQAAVDDASDGDVVEVQPGRYTGPGNRDIDLLNKAITVRSTNPGDFSVVAATFIDCNGTELDPHRGFDLSSTQNDCVLDGLTIFNGYGPNENWDYEEGSSGGAIHTYYSNPVIRNCIIVNNLAYYGGGISWIRSTGVISNCIFEMNGAIDGGGVFCHAAELIIEDCTFRYNNVNVNGGGVFCYQSEPSIENCLFQFNDAYDVGGGICSWEAAPEVSMCVFIGNSSGAYYNFMSESKITNCTFLYNSGPEDGGIIVSFGNAHILYPAITMRNSILWNNTDEFEFTGCCQCGCQHIIAEFNILKSDWQYFPWIRGIENITADPCFVDSMSGDYHLKSQAGRWDPDSESWVLDVDDVTSPGIDAGDPMSPIGLEPFPNGGRINMGACGGTPEASKSPANWRSIADITNDWVVDSNDLRVFADYWLETGECIPSDFDRSQFVDFDDFAIFGLQWSYPSALEPGIFYQVEDCNMEGGQNQPSVEDSNDTRFSVWVEGSYIHFEDLITANCCLDEIELQMTVEDGLITIYEIEHLTTPCFCLCDYPTTATLGPFEPGTYLLEVIDIDGKSLGIVEVTIGGSTEPGIVYKIEDCNRDASGVFAAEPPDPTRFTVTVEGLYIHFKDVMTANCCPDKLELEMAVEDNLITIYETEYTSEGCRCICSFPITATLGPFEPGSYTLEVYETMGGFIGSTIITIGPGR